jgi:hypothetical protein
MTKKDGKSNRNGGGKMKVSELDSAELDYWVAKAIGHERWVFDGDDWVPGKDDAVGVPVEWNPSRNWEDCGPLIEEWDIALSPIQENGGWMATVTIWGKEANGRGYSALEAVCRAIVASVYGKEVPDAP